MGDVGAPPARGGPLARRADSSVRANYGASLSPDATAFAHIVDDGGYPRAVQRFLRGWRASSSRDVVLPVEGPVERVIHSADGHWLACQVAPEGSERSQIWVVTTDPDDRMARRIDYEDAGMAELVSWDGPRVAATLMGEDGVGQSCLIDPANGDRIVLDRRSGGRLVDAWGGASLVRVGPRGYQELIMLHGLTEIALLPSDPGSTTDVGVILDDHQPRRIRFGPTGEEMRLYHPAKTYDVNSAEGYVRALIRSDNGADHSRLLEVTATADGVSYFVVAERPDCDLDEFVISGGLSTVALLWNIQGRSEIQILEYMDKALSEAIPLPATVANELSISAGRSMVALTVRPHHCRAQSNSWNRGRGNGSGSIVNPAAARWSADSPWAQRSRPSPLATVCASRRGCTGRRQAPPQRERWCICTAGRRARRDRATTECSRICSTPESRY